jgi:hypothetical protein
MKKFFFSAILLIAFTPSLAFSLPVIVSFDILDSEIYVGDQFSVNLVADIPDPVFGFGLDVNFSDSIIGLVFPPTVGSSWNPIFSLDGDGLAGLAPLAPFPLPSFVFGSGIVLANFTFDAISAGSTVLEASLTSWDLSEGFSLAFPALPGSFAEVSFLNTTVSVLDVAPVPEPATLLLLFVGIIALVSFRSYRKV